MTRIMMPFQPPQYHFLHQNYNHGGSGSNTDSSSTSSHHFMSTSSWTKDVNPTNTYSSMSIAQATEILTRYDQRQQQYMKDVAPQGSGGGSMGGGTAALQFLQTQITIQDRKDMKQAIYTLTQEAHRQRAVNPREGRIMLGICAQNVQEGLMGLKSWVPALNLPRGLLHGMDVDGKPIPPEELGSIYIKYNTGGCMTFADMRKTGMGFDALWRPGDCVLERYDGDFRGVYLNVELNDSVFRQFGVLPTDLFMEPQEEEDEEDW